MVVHILILATSRMSIWKGSDAGPQLVKCVRAWYKSPSGAAASSLGAIESSGMSVFDSGKRPNNRTMHRAMCDSAASGDLEAVRVLHQSGADLRVFDDEPLCRACASGHIEVVRYLHQNGAALDARDNEPLCQACAGGHLEVVRYLHQSGIGLSAREGEPLCGACQNGRLDVVRYLHENGVELGIRDHEPLYRACESGQLEIVRYLHQNGVALDIHNNELLRRATARRNQTLVWYLHGAGACPRLLSLEARGVVDRMKQELRAAPPIYHPSAFWTHIGEINERILDWSGEANFKRTLNQNYFNFIPAGADDARMVRMHRLKRKLGETALRRYTIEDPDYDPSLWMSWYPDYYIFKEPDRAMKRELYREYLALAYEYSLRRDNAGVLPRLQEPILGNPIRVHRDGSLISQDIINSVRERHSLMAARAADREGPFLVAELGAGYGRLGYVMLITTECRYFVFDIPPALYLSQWYLTTLFPDRRSFPFRHFDAFEQVAGELSEAQIAFFTPNQLAKFPSEYFDVFATISSLHEMRRDQISHYMSLMGRTTKSVLYLKQQKNYVNSIDNLVIGKDDYPVPTDWFPAGERFDLINPGFFERVYRRHEQ
jgi:putative sugar O-methyltransferase